MIQQQLVTRGISDQRVIQAFRAVPRKTFVPAYLHNRTYGDERLPIGLGQTISPPYVVARMLEDLAIDEDSRVLEVGTGSGYQTALLASLARSVYTIELLPELSARARRVLLEDLEITNVEFRVGDGFQGWSDAAPFDAIVVNAAADEVPWPLQGQLRPGARLVMPLGERDHVLTVMVQRGSVGEPEVLRTEELALGFGELQGEARD
ncbi:MAG: protein-L-isoaspartate(D-aspartate) O-methyltransferase [Deltaproteobacteria bacterium]|nr:protein-L-isoaspartate(D-aspartate) O-methyltransferase [Deltaproteobacteria bacterium]